MRQKRGQPAQRCCSSSLLFWLALHWKGGSRRQPESRGGYEKFAAPARQLLAGGDLSMQIRSPTEPSSPEDARRIVDVLRRSLRSPEQIKMSTKKSSIPRKPGFTSKRKADGARRAPAAFPVCLTDIIEDMFPSLSAEDQHRIAVANYAISNHQTGSEQDEGQQHEYQNPQQC